MGENELKIKSGGRFGGFISEDEGTSVELSPEEKNLVERIMGNSIRKGTSSISASNPIKDSAGRGKRIAKTVIRKIEKPGYKKMIKAKQLKIKKSLDAIIAKGGPGSGRKPHPDWTQGPPERHPRQPVKIKKSLEQQKLEALIILKSERIMCELQGNSVKVSDLDLVKGYGSIQKIPGDMMKAEDARPPKDWWDNCLERAKSWADDPARVCGSLWANPERWDITRGGGESSGKGEATKEAYGKMEDEESVLKMIDEEKKVKDFGGTSQVIAPSDCHTEDLSPSEKNISS